MKKGIFFDLDGTLWDSSQAVIDAWNECIARNTELNRSFTREQMQSYMGKTLDKIRKIEYHFRRKMRGVLLIITAATQDVKTKDAWIAQTLERPTRSTDQ